MPRDALRAVRPHAVTDVTGFGLLGHAYELAQRSGVRAVIDAEALPAAARRPRRRGRRASARAATRRNRDFAGPTSTHDGAPDLVALAYDPQTAGGLLVAPRGKARRARVRLRRPRPAALSRSVGSTAGAGVRLR